MVSYIINSPGKSRVSCNTPNEAALQFLTPLIQIPLVQIMLNLNILLFHFKECLPEAHTHV